MTKFDWTDENGAQLVSLIEIIHSQGKDIQYTGHKWAEETINEIRKKIIADNDDDCEKVRDMLDVLEDLSSALGKVKRRFLAFKSQALGFKAELADMKFDI